jgi:peptidoglycan/LPS O-acetylase OafA/YrhL
VQWEERGYFNNHITTLHKYIFSPIAKTSYGMYLYHPSIIAACWLLTPIIGFSLSTTLALAITFFVSALSYYWIERPILELKKRLL